MVIFTGVLEGRKSQNFLGNTYKYLWLRDAILFLKKSYLPSVKFLIAKALSKIRVFTTVPEDNFSAYSPWEGPVRVRA